MALVHSSDIKYKSSQFTFIWNFIQYDDKLKSKKK